MNGKGYGGGSVNGRERGTVRVVFDERTARIIVTGTPTRRQVADAVTLAVTDPDVTDVLIHRGSRTRPIVVAFRKPVR